jgi:hypothetical protein
LPAEILCLGPITELDPVRLSVKMQVWRVVFMVGTNALLDGKLGRTPRASATGNASSDLVRGLEARKAAEADA